MQILDQIDRLDEESDDQETLENLRKHLQQEREQQGLFIGSSVELMRHELQTQVLPISTHVLESAFTISTVEKQSDNIPEEMMISAVAQTIIPMDSKEQMNISLALTDAKELYEELQKMRNSIEIAFENTQIPRDDVDTQLPPVQSGMPIKHLEASINTIRLPGQNLRESNSMAAMSSPLIPANNVLDSTVISSPEERDLITDHGEQSLAVVGNAKKYSIILAKAKDQQAAIATQRAIFHSRRDYGEVYVRHKVTSCTMNLQCESL